MHGRDPQTDHTWNWSVPWQAQSAAASLGLFSGVSVQQAACLRLTLDRTISSCVDRPGANHEHLGQKTRVTKNKQSPEGPAYPHRPNLI